ncbi:acylphosphatase [Pseudooceanicola algae]|uniref:Acylphosphatase n=1 Tax=Pseudooceanicola algae TaxID=1537215 RepID=A0A418SJP3_9RHOB|nr:acylphosphatase [Pseudooceanicola algae]QPM90648.1 Acylphosphatase [Pseudooceanicola algae]
MKHQPGGPSSRQIRVTGRVQGVAFRAWTRGQARKLGLAGWVRNDADGSVTALLHGEAAAVENMINACWTGPGAAEVRDVQATPATPPEWDDFRILR